MFAKKVLVFTVVMLLSIASVCYAGLEAGQTEVGVMGSYGITKIGGTTGTVNTWLGSGSVGYLVTRQIQLGVSGIAMGSSNSTSVSAFFGLGQFKYNFAFDKAQTVVPYLGAQLGFLGYSNHTSDTGFSYGALGGLKFFVSEKTSLNLEANYLHTEISNVGVDNIQFLVGFSVYFGGK
jgi:hypothetical protein